LIATLKTENPEAEGYSGVCIDTTGIAAGALAAIIGSSDALAKRVLLLQGALPALVTAITEPLYDHDDDDDSGRLSATLVHLFRVDPPTVAAVLVPKLTAPSAAVRKRARRALTKIGYGAAAIDTLKLVSAEVAALRARVAELEAVPVNTRAAIVELAAAVRAMRRRGD